jgi:L-seryl-tRNA(Ser) seleniumtransferase
MDKMKRLPDTTGMKNEIIIQNNLRIVFDRAMEVPGGKFVAIAPTLKALEGAISEKTVAIHYAAPVPEDPQKTDVIPLQEVINVGHKHGVPIIVDAAGQTYPTDRLNLFVGMGCDLVCHSGKYFSAPNSTGYVCGRKDLIEAVEQNSFVGPGAGWIGRGYKLDRQEVISLVVALKRWVNMDHETERLQPARERRARLMDDLKNVPNMILTPQPYRYHAIGLEITLEKKTPEETTEMVKSLREGDPCVYLRSFSENRILINTMFLKDDDVHILSEKLKSIIV